MVKLPKGFPDLRIMIGRDKKKKKALMNITPPIAFEDQISPKVFNADPSDFRKLVQELTGIRSDPDSSTVKINKKESKDGGNGGGGGGGDGDNNGNGGGSGGGSDGDNNGSGGSCNNGSGDGYSNGDRGKGGGGGSGGGRGNMKDNKMDFMGQPGFDYRYGYHAGDENGYPIGQLHCAREIQSIELEPHAWIKNV